MPPFAADGGSSNEREDGNDSENERGGLPSAHPLLLFNTEVLLFEQTLLLLGELLLGGNSSLSFFSGMAEQGVCFGRGDEHHRGDDAQNGFHITVPFLEMGTKNPARESGTFVPGIYVSGVEESGTLNFFTCYVLYHKTLIFGVGC